MCNLIFCINYKGHFLTPFFVSDEDTAFKIFRNVVSSDGGSLYYIGSFDCDTGKITCPSSPRIVCQIYRMEDFS